MSFETLVHKDMGDEFIKEATKAYQRQLQIIEWMHLSIPSAGTYITELT